MRISDWSSTCALPILEPKLAVHGAPLGGPQQMVMRDADRMQRRFDLAVPEDDEIEQCREVRRQTIVLPHEQLQQRWRLGPMIKDFGGCSSEEHTTELQSLMRNVYGG